MNYANGNRLIALAAEDNYVWAATDGGVVCWDLTDDTYVQYATANGLVGSEVNEVLMAVPVEAGVS